MQHPGHQQSMAQASALPSCVVISIGGNALDPTSSASTGTGQRAIAERTLLQLQPLLTGPDAIVLTHGNGPQVGALLEHYSQRHGETRFQARQVPREPAPLDVCVAESQGELGYLLSRTLHDILDNANSTRAIASLLTLVEVDTHDAAFQTPSKPIGRAPRRMVASPAPRAILNLDIIRTLLRSNALVIAGGGGGIPVCRRTDDAGVTHLEGVAAVVDKDATAALLADAVDARLLLFVTAVPCVYASFGKPQQRAFAHLSADQARTYAAAGHFAPGTMGPKIAAALRFLQPERPAQLADRQVLICSPDNVADALAHAAGTWISL